MSEDYELERLKQECDYGKNLFYSVYGSTFVVLFGLASLGVLKTITTWKSPYSIILFLLLFLIVGSFILYNVRHFQLLKYCYYGGDKNGKKETTKEQNRTILPKHSKPNMLTKKLGERRRD